MSILVVMIDDTPWAAGTTEKIEELQGILPDPEFLVLVPLKSNTPSESQSIMDSYDGTPVNIRCWESPPGDAATVEDFVDWCAGQLAPVMNRVAVIFCDYRLKINPKAMQWEYRRAGDEQLKGKRRGILAHLFRYGQRMDDLEGMKDLYKRLNQLHPQTQWVFLTNHPKSVKLVGFAIYTKGAKLKKDDAFAIVEAASEIASRDCDIETYLAYLDKHHFEPDDPLQMDSLRHFVQQQSEWPLACQACVRWIRPAAFMLRKAKGVLPDCVFEPSHIALDHSVWERFHHSFLLFLNPDWHILRFLSEKLGETEPFALDARSDGSYVFGTIPTQMDIGGLKICLDNSTRSDSLGNQRNEINIAGRHYGTGNYACCLPATANLIASVLFENVFKKKLHYGNKCMFVCSNVDHAQQEYRVVFETFCDYRRDFDGVIKVLDGCQDGGFKYEARYAEAGDRALCSASCAAACSNQRFTLTVCFPIKRFGADPW